MRTLIILCTAVAILQTTSGAPKPTARGDPNKTTVVRTQNDGNQRIVTTTTRAVKPKAKAAEIEPVDEEPETNADENSAESAEPPKTIRDSGRRLAKTAKNVANRNGASILNGFSGLLKSTSGAFNFFGNFLLDRSKNVKDVARKKFDLAASLSNNTALGAGHLIDSARTIGAQGGKTMHSLLKKGTALGVSATKLGGTVAGTPISIANDLVSTGNRVAKIPGRLSKSVTNGYIKPALNILGPDSDETTSETPASEEESATEDVVPPPKPSPKPAPQKPAPQKPAKTGAKVTKK